MLDLTGRKALVTGASGGIGEAIARMLHAQGTIVGLHGTRAEKLEAVACRSRRARPMFLLPIFPIVTRSRHSARKPKPSWKALIFLSIMPELPRTALFVRMSDSDWESVLEVNLTATFLLTAHADASDDAPARYGRVINITSIVGVTGNPGQANYCASKAGMIGFSKSLAQEVAPRNVTVNCVAPGFIETAMTEKLNDKQKESILGAVPHEAHGKRR